jgi:hypothetical protein
LRPRMPWCVPRLWCGLRRSRLRKDPSRHVDGLRRRAYSPGRRIDRGPGRALAKVAEDAATRSGPAVRRSMSSEPKCRLQVGRRMPRETIEIHAADAALKTLVVHRAAFAEAGVASAMERVIGIVVQPGVEFGNANVALYKPDRARSSFALDSMPGLAFRSTFHRLPAGRGAVCSRRRTALPSSRSARADFRVTRGACMVSMRSPMCLMGNLGRMV